MKLHTHTSHHDTQAQETAITCPLHIHAHIHALTHSHTHSQLAEESSSRGWVSRQGYFHSEICCTDYSLKTYILFERFHLIAPKMTELGAKVCGHLHLHTLMSLVMVLVNSNDFSAEFRRQMLPFHFCPVHLKQQPVSLAGHQSKRIERLPAAPLMYMLYFGFL